MGINAVRKKWMAIRTDEFERGRFLRQLELNIVRGVWIGIFILVCVAARNCGTSERANQIVWPGGSSNLKVGEHAPVSESLHTRGKL